MTSRVAALALAATPLIAAPAFADAPDRAIQTGLGGLSLNLGDASFYVSAGHDNWRGRDGRHYRTNQWNQRPWEVRQLRRDAMQRCAAAIQRQGYRTGFRDVDIDDDVRIRQLGPRGFQVRFDDVEFEGRRREVERDVRCTVRHGNVVEITGLPQPGQRGNANGHRYGNDWDRGRRTGPGGVRGYGGELRGGHSGS